MQKKAVNLDNALLTVVTPLKAKHKNTKVEKTLLKNKTPDTTNINVAVVTIKSMYFYSDWPEEIKHEIVLKDIWGFELHWRGDGWHIVVVTKEKLNNGRNYTYELSHFVYPKQIAELIADKRCVIKSFKNCYSSNNFIESVNKVLEWSKSI